MTREAMIQEITKLPDDVLNAIFNLIKVAGVIQQDNEQVSDLQLDRHKYRSAGSLKGKIILHEDDDFWEEAKSYVSEDHPELNTSSVLQSPKPGIGNGDFWMSDDFDEPLDEMMEYMY